MIALIDSDILCYRVAFKAKDESSEVAVNTLKSFVADIMLLHLPEVFDFEFYLTGKTNFRHSQATTVPYKGNRPKEKPAHLEPLRSYLLSSLKAKLSVDEEADDMIAKRATELGDECVIVSIDKDFNQVPGWHYNFLKRNLYYVTPEEGLLFFYKQLLMGDTADNIQGIRGVGEVKAGKILKDATTAHQLYQCCVEAMGAERVLENARLLWLRRKPDEMWEPPSET